MPKSEGSIFPDAPVVSSTGRKPMGPTPERLAYTVNEVCILTPFGRTTIYKEIKARRLRTVWLAGRRLIMAQDLRVWLDAARGT